MYFGIFQRARTYVNWVKTLSSRSDSEGATAWHQAIFRCERLYFLVIKHDYDNDEMMMMNSYDIYDCYDLKLIMIIAV